jgi:hypothetical protein
MATVERRVMFVGEIAANVPSSAGVVEAAAAIRE